MSAIITVQQVEKSFGPRTVLAGVSFAVQEQDRIGIVGVNGSGKSTLLRLLVGAGKAGDAAETTPDAGLITRRRGLTLAYVPQEPLLDPESTVRTALSEGQQAHTAAHARLAALEQEVTSATGPRLQAALEELAALHDRLTHEGGWDQDHELRGLAAALRLPPGEARIGTLSGGERRRVALCQALLSHPDVLALDEPTNHLDNWTVEWLEGRLLTQFQHRGALLLITHDRYFLDRVATRIFELDRGRLHAYEGGYERFLEKQAERLREESAREQERVSFIRRELDWIRRGPQARGTKQKARIDRFEAAVAAQPESSGAELRLRLACSERLGKTVLELRGVGKSLGGRRLFGGLSLVMKPGDRIGVVGDNGAGKTTLVRMILGLLPPDEGEVVVGQNSRFAFLDQGRADLREDRSVLEEVGADGDHVHLAYGSVHVRTFLRMLLFDDRFVDAKVSTLSGGERNRIQLAKLLKQGGNFLVLDEPTNDLDLMTLAVLEEALCEFPGCALIVSHDRWFLDRVATAILAFEDGRVTLHEGNYSTYRARAQAAKLLAEQEAPAKAEPPRRAATKDQNSAPRKGPRRLSFREQQELEGMEAAILTAESSVTDLEQALADPGVYQRGAEVAAMLTSLERARAEVERLYARWAELEAISSAART